MEGSTRNIRPGALISITAFLVGAVQNALIKSIRDHYPAVVIVFIQYAFCLLILLPGIFRDRFTIMKSRHAGLLIFRSLMGLGYFYGVFYAFRHDRKFKKCYQYRVSIY